ncbi:MAG: hypothetical protein KDA57_23850, partial [Planctomycetales bacterium]|nr:hypothetical protein [Planctomycetales bacterium]
GPVVCGAAGFHENEGGCFGGEEAIELSAGKPVALDDAVVSVGDGDLEDILCQVDGKDPILHVWTPPVAGQVVL